MRHYVVSAQTFGQMRAGQAGTTEFIGGYDNLPPGPKFRLRFDKAHA